MGGVGGGGVKCLFRWLWAFFFPRSTEHFLDFMEATTPQETFAYSLGTYLVMIYHKGFCSIPGNG